MLRCCLQQPQSWYGCVDYICSGAVHTRLPGGRGECPLTPSSVSATTFAFTAAPIAAAPIAAAALTAAALTAATPLR